MLIVFDENVPNGIVDALIALAPFACKRELAITSITKLGLNGKPDEAVLHAVGKKGILISYDKDFKTQRGSFLIIKQHGIGVFWIR